MAAAAGERPADLLAGGGVAGRVQAGHGRGAVVGHDPHAAGAPHRALEDERDREQLGERVDPHPHEGLEEVGLQAREQGLEVVGQAVDPAVDGLGEQRAGDDRPAPLRPGALEHRAVLAVEGRPVVEGALGHRRVGRGDAVGVRELHAGQLGAGLGREQVRLAGVDVAAERAAEEGAAAGGQHGGAGPHAVAPVGLPLDALGARRGPVAVHQQLEGGAVVEDASPRPGPPAGAGASCSRALEARPHAAGPSRRRPGTGSRTAPARAPAPTSRRAPGASTAGRPGGRRGSPGWPWPIRARPRWAGTYQTPVPAAAVAPLDPQ